MQGENIAFNITNGSYCMNIAANETISVVPYLTYNGINYITEIVEDIANVTQISQYSCKANQYSVGLQCYQCNNICRTCSDINICTS